MNGKYRILIIIGLSIYCFAFQGARGLYEPDEGRYTAVAMEMLRQGNWLEPHLHREQPHWTKPPLTYWTIAASVTFLGRNEFAARLVSSLSFFFSTYLVYLLGQLFLERRAWLAPLVYSSFLFPAVASNIITTDGLLTLWETSAI
jgi:4-amino-4-deoxy-L-arabinose transferase-like glycosyltransferase